ncbi:MAG: sugar kinase [Actinomycetota bacterium]|nr:sugar kinase [Actinomycetota bacterium]
MTTRGGVTAVPAVLTVGEALVAAVPTGPVTLEACDELRTHVGGAEVNVAVGLVRLGVPCRFVGRVGDDPLGRRVAAHLLAEGVDVRRLRRDPRPTGLYLREWLPDGARRPYYYRTGSAGSGLVPSDVPADLDGCALVHLTGITTALGPGPRAAVERAVDLASRAGVPVSFDANYRPALWPAGEFLACVRPLLGSVAILFVGEEEAELLFGTSEPAEVFVQARDAGVGTCVLRRAERGACALEDGAGIVERRAPATAVDPVGAGDAFDAGFLAAHLAHAPLHGCLAVGVHCGARAVEVPGEHDGAPTRGSLPEDLRALLDAGG